MMRPAQCLGAPQQSIVQADRRLCRRRGPRAHAAPGRPGVLENDLAFIQDHTSVDLLTPLGGVQDAHAEVRLITRARCPAAPRAPPR
jgi:hypothetical protein